MVNITMFIFGAAVVWALVFWMLWVITDNGVFSVMAIISLAVVGSIFFLTDTFIDKKHESAQYIDVSKCEVIGTALDRGHNFNTNTLNTIYKCPDGTLHIR